MVLSHLRSCDAADASSPGRTLQVAELCHPCRVRAVNTPFPTHAPGVNRLYGLSDHKDLRTGIGDAPLAGRYALPRDDGDRGRGDTDGNQGAQGTRAQSVRFTFFSHSPFNRFSQPNCSHALTLTVVVCRHRRTFIPAIARPLSAPIDKAP